MWVRVRRIRIAMMLKYRISVRDTKLLHLAHRRDFLLALLVAHAVCPSLDFLLNLIGKRNRLMRRYYIDLLSPNLIFGDQLK
jgi:hypothetical protein